MAEEKPNYEEIARPMVDLIQGIGLDTMRLMVQSMRLLVRGRPVPPKDIADALGVSEETVDLTLNAMGTGVKRNEAGDVVEIFGLSLNPTRHRFMVGDQELFVWCAGDAISFAAAVGQPVRIESTDPVSGDAIRIETTPEEGVKSFEPETAVVSWVTSVDPEAIRESFCNLVNFFTSPETARQYLSKHPRLKMFTVREAEEVNRTIITMAGLEDILRE
ncbi:MAG: organomercurial lyase [Thermoplasmata archaeon]